MECVCPLPASLGSLPVVDCPENLGQIQKLTFRRFAAGQWFADELLAAAIANWTPLLGATDDTKVITTHTFANHVIPPAEAITEGGGDNTTQDGIEEVLGVGPTTATGNFRDVPNNHVTALKALICEILTVAMINNNGRIWVKQPGGAGNPIFGIPIYTWFISDAGSQGLNTKDLAPFRYALIDGWREDLVAITPTDFNALIDLGPL